MYKGYYINKEFNSNIKLVKKNRNHKTKYLEKYICLDTETSHNHDIENTECWLYQWAFTFDKSLYYGRTPKDLCEKLLEISDYYNLDYNKRVIILVHNLPFDFSFLHSFFQYYFGEPKDLLAYANHKVFNVVYPNGLEFRCSYKLTNDSLARICKKLNTKHRKLVDGIDYNLIRNQTTPLYKNDWKYMFYDVIVLDEVIERMLEIYNDTIATMPLTSTGYIRRSILREFKKYPKEKYNFQKMALTPKTYRLVKDESSGGISHGNRHYKGKVVDIEVIREKYRQLGYSEEYVKRIHIRHRDFRSHYPSKTRVERYSRSALTLFTNNQKTKICDLLKYKKDFSIYCVVRLTNAKLKTIKTALPYLQLSHCTKKVTKGFEYLEDNGRLLGFIGTCEVTLHILELELIEKQYELEYTILESYASRLDYLPKYYTDVTDFYFKGKSDFKDKVKELKEQKADANLIIEAETDLMKSKNGLNGMFGCCMTDICRADVTLKDGEWKTPKLTESDIAEKIDKYYFGKTWRNHCLHMQWGAETTLYGRLELIEYAEVIASDKVLCEVTGSDGVLYSDTDSLFYISTPEIEEAIERLNGQKRKHAIEVGAYITKEDGTKIFYDEFEKENELIGKFIFLHSKCYAYEIDGELFTTIAGVTARGKKYTRSQELGKIENLKEGFTFVDCGGTKAKYIKDTNIRLVNGNLTCGGCVITNTTKTLSNKEYIEDNEISFYNGKEFYN